jgi:hypothetical protein
VNGRPLRVALFALACIAGTAVPARAADWSTWQRQMEAAQSAWEPERLVGAEQWLQDAAREAERQDPRSLRILEKDCEAITPSWACTWPASPPPTWPWGSRPRGCRRPERALEIAGQQYLPEHATLATGMLTVVDAYARQGDFARADAIAERVCADDPEAIARPRSSRRAPGRRSPPGPPGADVTAAALMALRGKKHRRAVGRNQKMT